MKGSVQRLRPGSPWQPSSCHLAFGCFLRSSAPNARFATAKKLAKEKYDMEQSKSPGRFRA